MSTQKYTTFHRERMGEHLYPTEFVVRTMLGRYPGLTISRDYAGKTLLDLGFGDGRNLPLFANLGVLVFGVEPDKAVCEMVARRVGALGIACTLQEGHNSAIPFEDGFFDFVVACHSIYYVREGETFEDNAREVARVLRPGGYLVASLPALDNFVLAGAQAIGAGHYRIARDPYELRNGAVFRAFEGEREVRAALEPWFDGFSWASFRDDWYGILVSGFTVVCKKKGPDMNQERN